MSSSFGFILMLIMIFIFTPNSLLALPVNTNSTGHDMSLVARDRLRTQRTPKGNKCPTNSELREYLRYKARRDYLPKCVFYTNGGSSSHAESFARQIGGNTIWSWTTDSEVSTMKRLCTGELKNLNLWDRMSKGYAAMCEGDVYVVKKPGLGDSRSVWNHREYEELKNRVKSHQVSRIIEVDPNNFSRRREIYPHEERQSSAAARSRPSYYPPQSVSSYPQSLPYASSTYVQRPATYGGANIVNAAPRW
ncbi:hypothetical protein C8J56DRAFT_149181 [Mycena floridula]|nr:hypothetical protein C8J56DRAFT_149181 [Mycena floridula]